MEVVLGGLILGLTQVVKKAFALNTRYVPATAIFISLVVIFAFAFFEDVTMNWSLIERALIGGLSAVGLWETTTKAFK